MCSGEDLSKVPHLHSRVAGGGIDPVVAQEPLNVPHVGASLQEVGGVGVTKGVWRDPALEARSSRMSSHELVQRARAHPSPEESQKDRGLAKVVDESGADLAEVEIEGGGGSTRERHQAILLAFAVPHQHLPLQEVHVPKVQPQTLPATDSRSVEHFQDRPIPLAEGGVGGRRFHEPTGLPPVPTMCETATLRSLV